MSVVVSLVLVGFVGLWVYQCVRQKVSSAAAKDNLQHLNSLISFVVCTCIKNWYH